MKTFEETTTRGGGQHGLKWERNIFSLTPVWTVDPSIECIKVICYDWLRRSFPSNLCDIKAVEFLDEGAFNRVYRIDAIAKVEASSDAQLKTGIVETHQLFKYAFRISLPVDPRLKSMSEVATIQYLNAFTTIPAPIVLHSSHSAKNDLGFEYTLQTYIPGHKLSSIWHKLGHDGRKRMVQQLALIQTELFSQATFRHIGNIYHRRDELASSDAAQDNLTKSSPNDFYVGKIVSNPFILQSAMREVVNRGPFRTSADWLSAQLENVVLECEILQESSDKNDLEAAERSGEIAKRLLALLPKLFPDDGSVEDTFLFHNDLSQENIFCSKNGTITAILDWEATSCLPRWAAYDFPQLLQGADYPTEPDPTSYHRGADDLLFQDRLLMWQQMELKHTYRETMERIWPEWATEHRNMRNRTRRDFHHAVDLCDSELCWNTITKWLNANDELQGKDEYIQLELF
ncbi:hypothetical protein K505DRAFT_415340 [Melanomma pulvis-pyrius CBS 109.77]|uniref:Aminoglycoside phosphotransferase domain-containing protein n=1 Tax=Melanomma pulvis-pyrius CBS 109.77 TaxID=1314802 RepID=A0A6A6XM86_9PLEO|nr:hypothetical protein K505DRAFT_415340 [Melanomma pulvis-pyrius CBS 109.77]